MKYLGDFLKIGLGFERLFFFAIIFFILSHIVACLWIITAGFKEEANDLSWMDDYTINIEYSSDALVYFTSLYFTITTITTVGYGDISGENIIEMIVSIVIMLIGVMAFSFATGSLSSIISNYDHAHAKL